MEGIYYGDIFITGIPSNEIFEEVRQEYKNALGTPHKTTEVARAQVMKWLENKDEELEIDKDFREWLLNTEKSRW